MRRKTQQSKFRQRIMKLANPGTLTFTPAPIEEPQSKNKAISQVALLAMYINDIDVNGPSYKNSVITRVKTAPITDAEKNKLLAKAKGIKPDSGYKR